MYKYIKCKKMTITQFKYIDRYYNVKELSKTIKVFKSDYDSILKAINNN